jgi:hypothetical protein
MSRVACGTNWFCPRGGLLFSMGDEGWRHSSHAANCSRSQRLASLLPLRFAGPQDCFGHLPLATPDADPTTGDPCDN